VPHRLFRRSIVWIALICQVLAGLGSMPVASAAAPSPPAMTAHCHDHAQMMGDQRPAADDLSAASDEISAASVDSSSSHEIGNVPDVPQPHHCKHGLCHCACAHVSAALPAQAMHDARELIHPALAALYRVPAVPDRAKAFFRPPI
jgi:hypothetical protein